MDTLEQVNEIARYYDAGGGNLLGLLLGSLALACSVLAGAVAVLWWQGNRRADALADKMQQQYGGYIEQLVDLNVSCVATLKDLSANLISLREAGVNMTDELKADIDRTREHLALKIDSFAEKIMRDGK